MDATALFSWMVMVTLKSAALLAGAGLAVLLWRRASAAQRHLAWTLALAGALLLPVLSAVCPAWRVVRLPAWPARAEQVSAPQLPAQPLAAVVPPAPRMDMPTISPPARLPEQVAKNRPPATTPASALAPAVTPPSAPTRTPPPLPWPAWALLGWGTGALLLLARWQCGQVTLRRIIRRAQSAPAAWCTAAPAGVRVLVSEAIAVPLAAGIIRPVILFPAMAADWTAERRLVALLHELAHLQRRDLLAQLLARLACALYWPNPLIWLAATRQRAEQEAACDDAVLAQQVKAADYAGHLLAIAALLHGRRLMPADLAMARSSKVGARIKGVLDGGRNRNALPRKLLITFIAVAVMLVVLLATLLVLPADTLHYPDPRIMVRGDHIFPSANYSQVPRAFISENARFVAWQPIIPLPLPEQKSLQSEVLLYDREDGRLLPTGIRPLAPGEIWAFSFKRQYQYSIDNDGNIVFASTASLDSADRNGLADIYLYKREQRQIIWASRPAKESRATAGVSGRPVISADGSTIAFVSLAHNLVPDDKVEPESWHTICIYHTPSGTIQEVYQREPFHTWREQSIGDLALSADGRYLVYSVLLKEKGNAHGKQEVAVYDTRDRRYTYATRGSDGTRYPWGNPTISPDGKSVAWISYQLPEGGSTPTADRLSYIYTINNGSIKQVTEGPYWAVALANQQTLAFTGQGSSASIEFRHHGSAENPFSSADIYLSTPDTPVTLISEASKQVQKELTLEYSRNENPSISGNGRYICYTTDMTNVSPRSSAGFPLDKRWNGRIRCGWAIHIYDRLTGSTKPLIVVTDVPTSISAEPASQASALTWTEEATGNTLFTSADIVRYDWNRQVFELTARADTALRALPLLQHRFFQLKDREGVIYRGTLYSPVSSLGFDGPAISRDGTGIPRTYRIEAWYGGRYPRSADQRFQPRLRMALQAAGLLDSIPRAAGTP